LRASELQLCPTIVSAHSAIMRLPAISIFESCPIRNVTTPAIIGPAASTTRPSVISPVASLIQPIAYGPTKPPRLPTEFIKAMPPAAAELNHSIQIAEIGHFRDVALYANCGVADRPGSFIELFLPAAGNDDFRPFGSKKFGSSQPDAAVAAGNKRNLPQQFCHECVPPVPLTIKEAVHGCEP
jgi:hypothetical protein